MLDRLREWDAEGWPAVYLREARVALPLLLDVAEKAEAYARFMIEGADYPPDEAEFLWALEDALQGLRASSPQWKCAKEGEAG